MPNTDLLGPWVRRFLLEYLVAERNLARNTQKSYRDTLQQFLPFIARAAHRRIEQLRVEDVSPSHTKAFLLDLERTRHCGIATRNQRLAAIRSLTRFIGLHSPEHLEWSGQMQTIGSKKVARPLIGYLEKDELDALLKAPDQRTAQGYRDYAVLLFLYNTGARADEVAQVRIGDLDLGAISSRDASSLVLHGKGNKTRRCPLWPRTVDKLQLLINGRSASQHVFLNRRAHSIRNSCVGRALRCSGGHETAVRGEEASKSPHNSPHDGDPLASSRCGHQHNSSLARARVPQYDQRVCRSRSGDEGQSPAEVRSQGWQTEEALA